MLPDFPNFIPLDIELKDPYNNVIGDFTPYSDISFATLQIWWNISEKLTVCLLNQNLVINYRLFHNAEQSGLSLIGKNDVDESIKALFEYLKRQNEDVKLVHVPEFVIKAIEDPNQFVVTEESDYNEYILDSAALSALEGSDYQLLRKKIRRFERTVSDKQLDIRALDLSLTEVQDELLSSIAEWESKNRAQNDPDHTEHHALKKTFEHAATLDIENLAVFIDNGLHGIMIFHRPLGKEYYVLHHLKANYELPYISDYIHHEVAKHAQANNVTKLNVEMDLGIENLRKHKMTLRPIEFLKKYTLKPVQ